MTLPLSKEQIEAKYEKLEKAVTQYLRELDNPVPDAMYRYTLRQQLRRLVGLPDEQINKVGLRR